MISASGDNVAILASEPRLGSTSREFCRVQSVLLFVLCFILISFPAISFAGRAPTFAVTNVESTLEEGVYLLDIDLDIAMGSGLLDAMESGVKLVFKVEIEISKPLRWLPDEMIAALAQRYQLTYRSLAQRYVVKNINTDSQETFVSLEEALTYLERIAGLPVIDADLVNPDEVDGRIRLMLDASYLPLPLRVRALTSKVWGASSPWVSWSL